MQNLSAALKETLAAIQLVVTDVDGVHTNDHVLLGMTPDDKRIELYEFYTPDGIVVKECLRHNIPVALISGRKSPAVLQRATDLGAQCLQGIVDKVAAVETLGVPWEQVLFIGNDIQDIALLRHAGFSVVPADGAPEAQAEATCVATKRGGEGVVREVLQGLLDAKGLWKGIIARERTLG